MVSPVPLSTPPLERSERFAVLWTKAHPTVAAYISAIVRDFHQTEDLLHQVALVLLRRFDEYDPAKPFVNWAVGIARVSIIEHRRKHATDKHQFTDEFLDVVAREYSAMSDELDRRRDMLVQCLPELTNRMKCVLRLRYLEEVPPKEIALQLGMTATAVRVMLHRAHVMLRQCIERRLDSEGKRA